jgi:GT2 family glycosyltransferase
VIVPSVPAAVDLVIVHRRQVDLLTDTVKQFLDQDVEVRIAVVDNASSTDEVARLTAELPAEVTLLPQAENLGFGPGANVGLRWFLQGGDPSALRDNSAPAEWLAVCPHDARPWPDCLATALAELARHPWAGLASADVGDNLTPAVDRYFGAVPERARVLRGWEPAGYPHGTLMFARRSCLEEIGLFDERYFAYVEEADLALRASAAAWQVGVIRGAEVRNASIGSELAVVDYLQQRNTLLLAREHYGRYALFLRTVMALWHLGTGLVSDTHRRRDPYWTARARLLALRDYALHRFGPPPTTLT